MALEADVAVERLPPPLWRGVRRRHVAGVLILAASLVLATVIALTSGYHISNGYARLGLYGQEIPGRPQGVVMSHRYDQDRVRRVSRVMELAGNLALLAPLAVALPLLWSRTRLVHVVVGAAGVSASLEVAQRLYNDNRVPQVSDVALNTAGAVLAYGTVVVVRGIWRRRRTQVVSD